MNECMNEWTSRMFDFQKSAILQGGGLLIHFIYILMKRMLSEACRCEGTASLQIVKT